MIYKNGVLDDHSRMVTAELKAEEMRSIETFIQEKLNEWCEKNKGKSGNDLILTAGELLGRNRFHWEVTVLNALNTWYKEHKNSNGNPSMDSGNILWNVLQKDTRRFETEERSSTGESMKTARKYKWDGK